MDQITVFSRRLRSQLRPNLVPIVMPKKGRSAIPSNTFSKSLTVLAAYVQVWTIILSLMVLRYGHFHLLVQKIEKLSLLQFRMPTQQGQPFMPTSSASQQFLPLGQGISSPNVGIPPNQSQPLQYSQPMQQLPPRPPLQMQYIQTSMPITSSAPPPQPAAPPLNSQISGLGGPGVPFSSSYTVQHNVSAPSQFQPSQMHAQFVPVGGQPWMSTGGQGGPIVTPIQQIGQQSSDTAVTVPDGKYHDVKIPKGYGAAFACFGYPSLQLLLLVTANRLPLAWQHGSKPQNLLTPRNCVMHEEVMAEEHRERWGRGREDAACSTITSVGGDLNNVRGMKEDDGAVNVPSGAQQSSSDWQEYKAEGERRYYYNKKTRQSSWEKPLELMTPIELLISPLSWLINKEIAVSTTSCGVVAYDCLFVLDFVSASAFMYEFCYWSESYERLLMVCDSAVPIGAVQFLVNFSFCPSLGIPLLLLWHVFFYRADASTVWKEFTTADGRKKYYYNKVTKQSKWQIPEELKVAREQAENEANQGTQSEISTTSNSTANINVSSAEQSSAAVTSVYSISSSPVPVIPDVVVNGASTGSSVLPVAPSAATSAVGVSSPGVNVTPSPSAASGSTGAALVSTGTTPMTSLENPSSGDPSNPLSGASMQDIEEAKKGMAVAGKINVTPLEEKPVEDELLVYATKQEARNAFKALLESANVESTWTWEQTMRVIINDKRYGALKTLGERKQAFNEYLGQRKKLEAEERRLRMKKAREEFAKMLEECDELTSNTRWSKAISMFEEDERFKALDRPAEREDLFKSYLVDLQKKFRVQVMEILGEKEKAQEEYKRNRIEFRQYLETCGFIKVNTQWRKVQDRLEDDERCSRIEKIDRFEIFQEQLKRTERKNRDEFRKMMEEHVAAGVLTAKTHWRDYCMKVKDSAPYQAVALNTSGSTPKDLFEDIAEELEKQVSITTASTLEDFKTAVLEDVGLPPVSDINVKLVFEDLLERAREKEEKEAKKRQRLAKEFSDLLCTMKEITESSIWEESKQLFEESSEYRSIGEESFALEIFEEHVLHLQEKAKEKERKREEEKDEEDSETVDMSDSYGPKEEKKREKDRDRKHRRRHQSSADDISSDKEEKEESRKSRRHDISSDKEEKEESRKSRRHDISSDKEEKEESRKSRRHGSDRRKSRKHAYSPESESESKHKRHKRDHRDGSRRNGGYEELEDGELGEDGYVNFLPKTVFPDHTLQTRFVSALVSDVNCKRGVFLFKCCVYRM
ncbi:hypothetical protein RHSIM_Rhsim06G0064500 [Rhododendron simsii]|uniref:Pre-mRNA-processing protein 40A n=1 Tax=Rhododendron simsii TaxID=118357 RepID=A0A834LK78_RHOSS|nr:hypothetical protein RHSIM_Rhsim06G0064500 [Rhododendron simsii]